MRLGAIFTPRRISILGWALFVVYAYPGYLSVDPIQQLHEARTGDYSDWHPPAMSFVWSLVERVVPGTFGMLCLQSAAFLFGLTRILGSVVSPRRAALLGVAILLFPPVIAIMAVIWKDSQMAGYLLAGTALLLDPRVTRRMLGCGLLALGSATRYNALGATLPIVLLLFEWRPGASRAARYAIATATWLAMTFTASQANRLLTDRPQHTWYQCAFHDIAGVFHHARPHSDAAIERMLPGLLHVHDSITERIDAHYVPWSNYYLTGGPDRVFEFPQTDAERHAVKKLWITLLRHHPKAYLAHRLDVSLAILGVTENPMIIGGWDGFPPGANVVNFEAVQISMSHSAVQRAWVHGIQAIGASALYRGYPYFVIAMILVLLCRRNRVALTLAISGLCYEGTLFVAAVPDARYSHWLITCTVVAYVLTFVDRYRAGWDARRERDRRDDDKSSSATA